MTDRNDRAPPVGDPPTDTPPVNNPHNAESHENPPHPPSDEPADVNPGTTRGLDHQATGVNTNIPALMTGTGAAPAGPWAAYIKAPPFNTTTKGEPLNSELLCKLSPKTAINEPPLRPRLAHYWNPAGFVAEITASIARVEGATIQVVGYEVLQQCESCKEDEGPFSHCTACPPTTPSLTGQRLLSTTELAEARTGLTSLLMQRDILNERYSQLDFSLARVHIAIFRLYDDHNLMNSAIIHHNYAEVSEGLEGLEVSIHDLWVIQMELQTDIGEVRSAQNYVTNRIFALSEMFCW
ncbi:hypothetical protein LT330_006939 [Penicillium expansum]|nr:hypothetical protein LT330_006939 [Penicillium expansum]